MFVYFLFPRIPDMKIFLAALIKRKILNIGLWKVKSSRFSYTSYDQKSKKKF